MMKLLKGLLLVVVLIGLTGWVLGTERMRSALKEARNSVRQAVDDSIDHDDTAKLKKRLEKLQKTYPKRVGVLRTELAELDGQIGEVEAERQLCERVVALCDRDRTKLMDDIEVSTQARAQRLEEVARVKQSYHDRLERSTGEVDKLRADRELLVGALDQVLEEKSQLDSELARLNREIDSIKRNDQLIKTLKARENVSVGLTDSDLDSLRAVRRSVAERRAQQDAELAQLKADRVRNLYEARAILQVDLND